MRATDKAKLQETGGQENLDTQKNIQLVSDKMEFGTLPLTDELKKDALSALMDRYNAVKDERESAVKLYDRREKLYLASTSGDKDTLSEVMTTDGFNAVEDWVALLMDAQFPVWPPFQVKPKKKEITPEQLLFIRTILAQNMKDTNYEDEAERIYRQGVKFGTFVGKAVYEIKDDKRIRIVPKQMIIETENGEMPAFDENNEPVMKNTPEKYIEIEDAPVYRFVDLRKLFFRKDKCPWIIEQVTSNWSELEASNGGVQLYDNLEAARKTSPSSEDDGNDKLTRADGDVVLLEGHHIPVPILNPDTGKKEKVMCIVVVCNEKEVIRVQPTPYDEIPYLITKFMDKEGTEGLGLLEITERTLNEMNTRRTQALDANTHGLYGMKAVNMKYIKKPEQLKIRKDGLIELKETDKPIDQIISFFRPPMEYGTQALSLVDRVAADVVRTTRMKGVLMGEKVQPNPSASEWSGMMKEALKSVKVILRRVAHGQVEEWLKRAYTMNVLNRQKSWSIPIDIAPPPVQPAMQAPMGIEGVPPVPTGGMGGQMPLPGVPGMEAPVPAPTGPSPLPMTKWIEVTPEDIYSDGIDIDVVGTQYMEDEIVTRHQQMQKLDIIARYGTLPLTNEKGEKVIPNFYRELKQVMKTFGDEHPEEGFLPAPPPMPMPGMELGGPKKAPAGPGAPSSGGAPMPNVADLLSATNPGANEGGPL